MPSSIFDIVARIQRAWRKKYYRLIRKGFVNHGILETLNDGPGWYAPWPKHKSWY